MYSQNSYQPAANNPAANNPAARSDVSQPLQMDVSSATALVKHFDQMHLIELQEDDAKFDEFIRDLQQVKDIKPQRETLIAGNQSLAEYNLSLKPNFSKLKGELMSSYEELRSVRDRVIRQQSQLGDSTSDQQSPEVLLALLQTETAQSEEKSEKIASDFLDKAVSIDQFLEDYIASQTLFYTRQFKVGKMKDLLQNQNAPPQLPAHVGVAMPSWYQNTPPYPQNYSAMPQAY